MLDTEAITEEPYAVAVSWILNAVETISSFEPGITWFLACLDSSEKGLKSLIQSPHSRLGRAEVYTREIGIDRPLSLEPGRLLSVADASLFGFIGHLSLFKADIVEPSVGFKHNMQFPGLGAVCPEAVFVGTKHLFSFLALDVMPDGFLADTADCTRVITPGPESGETGPEMWELRAQKAGTCSLEPVHNLGYRPAGVTLDEKADVVRHDLLNLDHCIDLGGDGCDDFKQPDSDGTFEHGPAIFRAPHKVILQGEDCSGVFCVT
jgi:hypothetical protein